MTSEELLEITLDRISRDVLTMTNEELLAIFKSAIITLEQIEADQK